MSLSWDRPTIRLPWSNKHLKNLFCCWGYKIQLQMYFHSSGRVLLRKDLQRHMMGPGQNKDSDVNKSWNYWPFFYWLSHSPSFCQMCRNVEKAKRTWANIHHEVVTCGSRGKTSGHTQSPPPCEGYILRMLVCRIALPTTGKPQWQKQGTILSRLNWWALWSKGGSWNQDTSLLLSHLEKQRTCLVTVSERITSYHHSNSTLNE